MPLTKLVEELGVKLKSKRWTIATAESCTGGGLSYWITSVSGSSDWFSNGYITYSNEAKCEMLGVDPDTIEKFGAVSEAVALEMAERALAISEADASVSITGIAGPTGGTPEKPVGTVYIAVAMIGIKAKVKHFVFDGSRQEVREQAIINAITLVLQRL